MPPSAAVQNYYGTVYHNYNYNYAGSAPAAAASSAASPPATANPPPAAPPADEQEHQYDLERERLDECLEAWREWVRCDRPDPDRWCEIKGLVSRAGMDTDDEDYMTWARFDINDPEGGHDEDGCPYGVHPWTRPRPRGYNWAVVRELLRPKWVAHYWYESATRHRWVSTGVETNALGLPIAATVPQHVVDELVNDGLAFME